MLDVTASGARARSGDGAGTSGDSSPPSLELEAVVGLTAHCPSCVAVSPAAPLVAHTAGAGAVLYDWGSDSQAAVLVPAPGSPVRALSCVAFSSDGRFLAGGQMGTDSSVLVWDVHTGEVMTELRGHAFSVRHVAFGPGDAVLLSAGSKKDGVVALWDWRAGRRVLEHRPSFHAKCAALLPPPGPGQGPLAMVLGGKGQAALCAPQGDDGALEAPLKIPSGIPSTKNVGEWPQRPPYPPPPPAPPRPAPTPRPLAVPPQWRAPPRSARPSRREWPSPSTPRRASRRTSSPRTASCWRCGRAAGG